MSRLDINEWTKITDRFTELCKLGKSRPGECYFQALEEIKPDLHSKLVNTEYDSSTSEHNLITLLHYLNDSNEIKS